MLLLPVVIISFSGQIKSAISVTEIVGLVAFGPKYDKLSDQTPLLKKWG